MASSATSVDATATGAGGGTAAGVQVLVDFLSDLEALGLSSQSTILDLFLNLAPPPHLPCEESDVQSTTHSSGSAAMLNNVLGVPAPHRVVVSDEIYPVLVNKARDVLAASIPAEVLSRTIVDLAHSIPSARKLIVHMSLSLNLGERPRTLPPNKAQTDSLTISLIQRILPSFSALFDILCSNECGKPLHCVLRPTLELFTPTWALMHDAHMAVLGENKSLDASRVPGGLFAQLERLKDPAGVEWADVPMDHSDESGLRSVLAKHRQFVSCLHDPVYIAFATLLTLRTNSTNSTNSTTAPFLYAMTPLIPVNSPSALLILLLMTHEPARMRTAFVTALDSEQHAPLRTKLASSGLDLRLPMPLLPYLKRAAPPSMATSGAVTGPPVDQGFVAADSSDAAGAADAVPDGGKKRRADGPVHNDPKRSRQDDDDGLGAAGGSTFTCGDAKGRGENARAHGGSARETAQEARTTQAAFTAQRCTFTWRLKMARPFLVNTFYRVPLPPLFPVPSSADTSLNGLSPEHDPSTSHSPVASVLPTPHLTPPKCATAVSMIVRLPSLSQTARALTAPVECGSARYILKITDTDRDALRCEAALFARASAAGLAPGFIGLFEQEGEPGSIGKYTALLMEDGGKALKDFYGLSREEKMRLYTLVVDLHCLCGITHEDIAARNVLLDVDGRFQLCDFGMADLHECAGEETCDELVMLKEELELDKAELGEAAA